MKQALLILAVGLGAFVMAGCQTSMQAVHPWERAQLADYTMRPDRDPLATEGTEHIYFSREASSGGRGVASNGCGCN